MVSFFMTKVRWHKSIIGKKYSIKCTYCEELVERQYNSKKVVCFPCKRNRTLKAYRDNNKHVT